MFERVKKEKEEREESGVMVDSTVRSRSRNGDFGVIVRVQAVLPIVEVQAAVDAVSPSWVMDCVTRGTAAAANSGVLQVAQGSGEQVKGCCNVSVMEDKEGSTKS
jgi:hypothetical protein